MQGDLLPAPKSWEDVKKVMHDNMGFSPPSTDQPAKANSKAGPPRPPKAEFFSLVEEARLVVGVVRIDEKSLFIPPGKAEVYRPAALADRLRPVFRETWDRIPTADSNVVLRWWCGHSPVFTEQRDPEIVYPSPFPKPLIMIKETGPWLGDPCCFYNGMVFPVALVTGSASTLSFEIARTLALFFRGAKSACDLYDVMVERPMTEWEQAFERQGKEWNDEDQERRWTDLHDQFYQHLKIDVPTTLARWGFEAAGCS